MSKAPKTDVETQTEDFDYLIPMRSGYQAPNREFFKSDERVRFYTGLRSYEVLIAGCLNRLYLALVVAIKPLTNSNVC